MGDGVPRIYPGPEFPDGRASRLHPFVRRSALDRTMDAPDEILSREVIGRLDDASARNLRAVSSRFYNLVERERPTILEKAFIAHPLIPSFPSTRRRHEMNRRGEEEIRVSDARINPLFGKKVLTLDFRQIYLRCADVLRQPRVAEEQMRHFQFRRLFEKMPFVDTIVIDLDGARVIGLADELLMAFFASMNLEDFPRIRNLVVPSVVGETMVSPDCSVSLVKTLTYTDQATGRSLSRAGLLMYGLEELDLSRRGIALDYPLTRSIESYSLRRLRLGVCSDPGEEAEIGLNKLRLDKRTPKLEDLDMEIPDLGPILDKGGQFHVPPTLTRFVLRSPGLHEKHRVRVEAAIRAKAPGCAVSITTASA